MSDLTPAGLWNRLGELDEWRRQLSAEIAQLPETIADLRETIEALRKVTQRLEMATAGIEVLVRASESTGLGRRLEDAASLVEEQSRLGSNLAGVALEELQRNVASANDLIERLTGRRG